MSTTVVLPFGGSGMAFMAHTSGSSADRLRLLAEQLYLEIPEIEQLLTKAAEQAGPGPDRSCGITYRSHDGVLTVASSDARARAVDEVQYSACDGPCLQAMHTGLLVRVDDLQDETRWGSYPGHALAAGISSSLSCPITIRSDAGVEETIGAVNVYSSKPGPWPADDEAAVLLLAHQVAGILHAVRALAADLVDAPRTATVLAQQHDLDIAAGMLMARDGCSADQAHERLDQLAVEGNVTTHQAATALIAEAEDFGVRDLPDHGQ